MNGADALTIVTDIGVTSNAYCFADTPPRYDTILPNIIPQTVSKELLFDNEDILRRPVPEIMTMDEALALQGTPIAESIDTNTLILNALEKMEAPDGAIPALKQHIQDAYATDRIRSLEETAVRT